MGGERFGAGGEERGSAAWPSRVPGCGQLGQGGGGRCWVAGFILRAVPRGKRIVVPSQLGAEPHQLPLKTGSSSFGLTVSAVVNSTHVAWIYPQLAVVGVGGSVRGSPGPAAP